MRPHPMHASFAALALSLGALAIAAPVRAQGTTRQLFCRGVSGMDRCEPP